MRAILMSEREEVLGVINRLRQLQVGREPAIEVAIAALHDAMRWLLQEAERHETGPEIR